MLELADSGAVDVIFHGCNCRKVMGAGIAAAIARKWPEVYQADVDSESLPGGLSYAFVHRPRVPHTPLMVFNLYTQVNPGPCFDLELLSQSLEKLVYEVEHWTERQGLALRGVGFPSIGCGIGGGNWDEVQAVIWSWLGRRGDLVHVVL